MNKFNTMPKDGFRDVPPRLVLKHFKRHFKVPGRNRYLPMDGTLRSS